jgi:hypothetical protein
MKKLLIVIALLLLNNSYAGQKIYKWTDENGNIHYSSEKPEDKQTDEVKVNTKQPEAPKVDPKAKEARRKKSEEFMEKHNENLQKTKEQAKVNKQKCSKAKQILAKFQEQVRMSRVNKDTGETEYLEDSSRAQILKESKKDIKKYCR